MRLHIQHGQAMSEMVVASAFVVVPLFLIVPIIGKYIDIQQATVSAARYVAWERTVHLPTAQREDYQSTGFDQEGVGNPHITNRQLQQQVYSRVFVEANTKLDQTDAARGRALWTYHDGRSMVNQTAEIKSDCPNVSKASCEIYSRLFVDTVVKGTGKVLSIATSAISWVTGSGDVFDVININGRNTAEISLKTTPPPTIGDLNSQHKRLIDINGLNFRAQAQVYSMSWSAGGQKHLLKQVQSLVPTKAINDLLNKTKIPLIGTLQDVASTVLLSPEIAKSNLKFGHIDLDVLPLDRYLKPNSKGRNPELQYTEQQVKKSCHKYGYCYE